MRALLGQERRGWFMDAAGDTEAGNGGLPRQRAVELLTEKATLEIEAAQNRATERAAAAVADILHGELEATSRLLQIECRRLAEKEAEEDEYRLKSQQLLAAAQQQHPVEQEQQLLQQKAEGNDDECFWCESDDSQNGASKPVLTGDADPEAQTQQKISKWAKRAASFDMSMGPAMGPTVSVRYKTEVRPLWTRLMREIESQRAQDDGGESSDSDVSTHIPFFPVTYAIGSTNTGSAFLEWRVRLESTSSTFWRHIIVSPVAKKRLTWALIGVTLISYDLIMIPLEVFDLPETLFLRAMSTFILMYWTLDILVNFITGVTGTTGLEMRPLQIAKAYAKSWLAFDVLICAFDWVMLLAMDFLAKNDTSPFWRLARTARITRTLRMLRALRLFRLPKIRMFIENMFAEQNQSKFFLQGLTTIKAIGVLLMLCHYLACAWYAIGKDVGTWLFDPAFDERSELYIYISAFHWTFAQFHGSADIYPGNIPERLFAVVTQLLGLFFTAVFVSIVTTSMMQMYKLHFDQWVKKQKLTAYLNENRISAELRLRIKSFARLAGEAKPLSIGEVEVLRQLPDKLRAELDIETKKPALMLHPWLRRFTMRNRGTVEIFCRQVIAKRNLTAGEILFDSLVEGTDLFIVNQGRLVYNTKGYRQLVERATSGTSLNLQGEDDSSTENNSSKPIALSDLVEIDALDKDELHSSASMLRTYKMSLSAKVRQVTPTESVIDAGSWLCEMVLWTRWTHRGTCASVCKGAVFAVNARIFGEVVANMAALDPDSAMRAAKRACKFAEAMDQVRKDRLNDLSWL